MENDKNRINFSVITLALLALVLFASCVKGDPAPPRDFALVDLLITHDDMPPGWKVEFPAGHYKGFYYPEEAVSVVFVPETGVRRAAGHDIYRYSSSDEAEFRLHNDFVPEVLNSGEFVPAGWASPILSADEDKFACYWKAVDVDPRKFMLCEWTARYDELIVYFVTWIIPDLMSLEEMKIIIVGIDQKMRENLYR